MSTNSKLKSDILFFSDKTGRAYLARSFLLTSDSYGAETHADIDRMHYSRRIKRKTNLNGAV
jgi:hypothetical protein